VHLNYMFAGTGKDGAPHQRGALADILAVRPGDNILFYVAEHGFYGFFRASQSKRPLVFYEHPTRQYLDSGLGGKTLTYRFFIEGGEQGVYRQGVDEWDALENPDRIVDHSVFNMQWSWIFKKLKGGRGCVSIPEEEARLLEEIIVRDNVRLRDVRHYTFANGEIAECAEPHKYEGDTSRMPMLHERADIIETEADLRVFFCSNIGRSDLLGEVVCPDEHGRITFIANEAKCSFGMRSIDLLLLSDSNKCLLIELKNTFTFDERFLDQLSGYARWVSSYKRQLTEIVPILILRAPPLCRRRGGKKFKYLSAEDCDRNVVSPWFKGLVSNFRSLEAELRALHIPKLSQLRVVLFQTNDDQRLTGFTFLDLNSKNQLTAKV